MDFSSDILIDFGLNLAGYLLVGGLVYLLVTSRRTLIDKSRAAVKADTDDALAGRIKETPEIMPRPVVTEFIALADQNRISETVTSKVDATIDDTPTLMKRDATRRADRRAICLEAKRLLAKGKSHGELMRQLPLTENELEMLSVAGKA
ncbi:MAG: hypothetical protein GY841_12135 [FCB group bacterium]|nr:hypothetical protein [FCB group bacterium]